MMKNIGDHFGTKRFYDKEAIDYDCKRWSCEIGRYGDATQKEILLSFDDINPKNKKNENILEIGIGTGRITSFLSQRYAKIIGVDFSQVMIKICREKLSNLCEKGKLRLINCNALALPFVDASFKDIISINVFSHISECESVILEISRVLKPGGFLVMNFPNLLSFYLPVGFYVNSRKKSVKGTVYSHWYRLDEIRRITSKASLKIKMVKGQIHYPSLVKEKNGYLFKLINFLNKACKDSVLKYICPTLFILCKKVGANKS